MIKGITRISLLLCTVILSMMMMYSSIYKFVDPMWNNQFAAWGYSTIFMYIVACVELILAVMIFIKQTRVVALIFLILLMLGAIYTHVSNFEPNESVTAIFLIGMSISTIILHWFDQKFQ